MKKALLYLLIIGLTGVTIWASRYLEDAAYRPEALEQTSPAQSNLTFEPITYHAHDGTPLAAWFIPAAGYDTPRAALGTLIHFHDYMGNMSAHLPQVDWLAHRGFNVLTVDYRGYGRSLGKPSTVGLQDDVNSVLNAVRKRKDIDTDRLVILGQGLGAAHAMEALSSGNRAGIRALVAEGVFTSYQKLVNDKTKGFGWLVTDRLAPEKAVTLLGVPLLLIHGSADALVPVEQAQQLFSLAHDPKQLLVVNQGKHLGIFNTEKNVQYRDQLVNFLTTALNARIAPPKP